MALLDSCFRCASTSFSPERITSWGCATDASVDLSINAWSSGASAVSSKTASELVKW